MQPTRRYWEALGVAAILAGGAVLFERPPLLVGAFGLLGWLLAMQLAFVGALRRFDRTLDITHEVTPATTVVDDPATLRLNADGEAAGLNVTATVRPGAGLDSLTELTTSLGEPLVLPIESSIAGAHTIARPQFDVQDAGGLFTERLRRGPTRELVVEPRTPGRIHIGEGGNTIASAFGDHTSQSGESGLVPAELREYVTGDSAARIDWNATARLATPHVRKFDVESALMTYFVVDGRRSLAVGPPGETAFEHLRAAALTYASVAESLEDPVSCVSVRGDSLEDHIHPAAATRVHERLRDQLRSLSVSEDDEKTARNPSLAHRSPTLDPTTRFGRTLSTYLERTTPLRSSDPLSAAVRYGTTARSDAIQIALFTDDTDRAGIRDAITEARRADSRIVIFLTPRVLYDSEEVTVTSIERTNDRYREFERFRRSISAAEHVTVYEVAPNDRLETVLSTPGNIA